VKHLGSRVKGTIYIVPLREAARALRGGNEGAQCSVDGLLVGEVLGDIGREKDEIRSGAIASEVFAADTAFQF